MTKEHMAFVMKHRGTKKEKQNKGENKKEKGNIYPHIMAWFR